MKKTGFLISILSLRVCVCVCVCVCGIIYYGKRKCVCVCVCVLFTLFFFCEILCLYRGDAQAAAQRAADCCHAPRLPQGKRHLARSKSAHWFVHNSKKKKNIFETFFVENILFDGRFKCVFPCMFFCVRQNISAILTQRFGRAVVSCVHIFCQNFFCFFVFVFLHFLFTCLQPLVNGGKASVVYGLYDYYHYGQDRFNDNVRK